MGIARFNPSIWELDTLRKSLINDGHLFSRPPGGWVRYGSTQEQEPETLSQLGPGFDVALWALRNYHYESINVGVSYLPGGVLSLAVKLRGSNPNFQRGRAINFNINIEENIPALLESFSAVESTLDETYFKKRGK